MSEGLRKRKVDDDEKENVKKQRAIDDEEIAESTRELFHMMNQINFLTWLGEADNRRMIKLSKMSRAMVQLDKPNRVFLKSNDNNVFMAGKVHLLIKEYQQNKLVVVDLAKFPALPKISVVPHCDIRVKFSGELQKGLTLLNLQTALLQQLITLPYTLKHLTYTLTPSFADNESNYGKINASNVRLESLTIMDLMYDYDQYREDVMSGTAALASQTEDELQSQRSYANSKALQTRQHKVPSTRVLFMHFPIDTRIFTIDQRLETLHVKIPAEGRHMGTNTIRAVESPDVVFFPKGITELTISRLYNQGTLDLSTFTRLKSLAFHSDQHHNHTFPESLEYLYMSVAEVTNVDTSTLPQFPDGLRKLWYDVYSEMDLPLSNSIESAIVRNVASFSNPSFLKYLKITGWSFPAVFVDFTNLEVLEALDTRNETSWDAIKITNMPKLRVLKICNRIVDTDVFPDLEYLQCRWDKAYNLQAQCPKLKTLRYIHRGLSVTIDNNLPLTLKSFEFKGAVTWQNDQPLQLEEFRAGYVCLEDSQWTLRSHRIVANSAYVEFHQVICVDLHIREPDNLDKIDCVNLKIQSHSDRVTYKEMPPNTQTLEVKGQADCITGVARSFVHGHGRETSVHVDTGCQYLFLDAKSSRTKFKLYVEANRTAKLFLVIYCRNKVEVVSDTKPHAVYEMNQKYGAPTIESKFLVSFSDFGERNYLSPNMFTTCATLDRDDFRGDEYKNVVFGNKPIKQSDDNDFRQLMEYARNIPRWEDPFKSMDEYEYTEQHNEELFQLRHHVDKEHVLRPQLGYDIQETTSDNEEHRVDYAVGEYSESAIFEDSEDYSSDEFL